jgi:hypothetical protein
VYILVLRTGFAAAWSDLRGVVVRVFPMLGRIPRRGTVSTPAMAP